MKTILLTLFFMQLFWLHAQFEIKMKKIILLIYVGMLTGSYALPQVTNQENTTEKILTTQQWLEDLEFTVKRLSEVHPNLYYRISRDSLDSVQKPESLTTSGRFEVQNYKPLNDRHIQPAGDGQ